MKSSRYSPSRKATDRAAVTEPAGFVMVQRESLVELTGNPAIKDRHRRVLLALTVFADSTNGSCFPSLRKLAERSRIRQRDISAITRDLENFGFITIERRGRRLTNIYVVHILHLAGRPRPGHSQAPISRSMTPQKFGTLSFNDNQSTRAALGFTESQAEALEIRRLLRRQADGAAESPPKE